MKITQVYELVNSAVTEVTGKSDLLAEDLSNVVDVGKEVLGADNIDNYVGKLVNHIGRVIFVDRKYKINTPSVLMDSWEYGSILEKISTDLPKAYENESWNLTDGQTYNQDVFYQPKVNAKFFNSKVTFEVPISFTERQVKESFSNANQLNGFVSMIYTSVENTMSINLDNLVMRTINNFIGEVYINAGVNSINLLEMYNAKTGETLTVDKALMDSDFIRFAGYTMALFADRLTRMSTLFNIGGAERFTPAEARTMILLSDFANSNEVYLKADTYNQGNIKLPTFDTVPYWQGSGKTYDFEDISKIIVKVNDVDKTISGVLGVLFDRNALGVTNLDRRVTTNYNAKAEFYNNYYKMDAGYFNDLNENFILFYIA